MQQNIKSDIREKRLNDHYDAPDDGAIAVVVICVSVVCSYICGEVTVQVHYRFDAEAEIKLSRVSMSSLSIHPSNTGIHCQANTSHQISINSTLFSSCCKDTWIISTSLRTLNALYSSGN